MMNYDRGALLEGRRDPHDGCGGRTMGDQCIHRVPIRCYLCMYIATHLQVYSGRSVIGYVGQRVERLPIQSGRHLQSEKPARKAGFPRVLRAGGRLLCETRENGRAQRAQRAQRARAHSPRILFVCTRDDLCCTTSCLKRGFQSIDPAVVVLEAISYGMPSCLQLVTGRQEHGGSRAEMLGRQALIVRGPTQTRQSIYQEVQYLLVGMLAGHADCRTLQGRKILSDPRKTGAVDG